MQTYRTFKAQIEAAMRKQLVWGSGHPKAPVMFLGWQMAPDEKEPFTRGVGTQVRHKNKDMGVPDSLLFYNYFLKTSAPNPADSTAMRDVLMRELIDFVPCRTIICLGAQVANLITGFNAKETDELRRTKFHSTVFPDTSFFVTYSPQELVAHTSEVNQEMTQRYVKDLQGVYDGDTSYHLRSRKF